MSISLKLWNHKETTPQERAQERAQGLPEVGLPLISDLPQDVSECFKVVQAYLKNSKVDHLQKSVAVALLQKLIDD